MTAPVTMLTDEVIEKAAIRHSDKEHSPFNSDARYHFKAGARFARARHKARLAEDAKVRARLFHALDNLYAMVNGECPSLLENDHHDDMVRDALAAAKERG